MKYNFLILGGAGMQGKIVAKDLLLNKHSVFLADLYKEGLDKFLKNKNVSFEFIDLRNIKKTIKLIKKTNPEVIINCAEGDWNINVYKAALATKKHVIDLGSEIPMTEEQIKMDSLFNKAGLTAITGCGSTPGINNIMLHYAHLLFDTLETVEAGFAWDSNIKKFVVPFSIQSIIEEFTDPALIVENGKWIKKIPLLNIEKRKFRKIGEQECFFVRHPETFTFYYYNKKDGIKNIRFYAGFPKHSSDVIRNFIETGLGSKKEVEVEGKKIKPVDMLSQSLRGLGYPKGYKEWENLWVNIWGEKDGKKKKIIMECIVNPLPGWDDAGCNIDTGMPASIIAQMIKDKRIIMRGSFAPGPAVPYKEFFRELRKRKMIVYRNGKIIN
ncbi:MAG: hypothetical protein COU51_03145 [Parcubacteria group bacterium CG10_big_fil_rev_8_21_14_0_10_36_14]|nr:MAG: hypothetical protein COU51_03145 [Parcubacteria group bacterium CG10_big_fil_rev_8_21_14_0_10_36_14]